MPFVPRTSVRELTDRLLDGRLADYLADRRGQGESFAEIAFHLRTTHDVTVTAETVRAWCADLRIAKPEPRDAA